MASETAAINLPKKGFYIEFMVGLFTIIGLLAFSYLAINIAKMKLFNTDQYEVTAQFDNISGLEHGARVEIAGVQVGEVSRITLKDTSALVTMSIDKDVKLRDDDVAAIRTKGIIGDRYVKIVPGSSEATVKNEGEIVDTESAVEFEEIIGKFIHKMDE